MRSRVVVNGVITMVDGEALAGGSPVGDPEALERQRLADPSLDHVSAIEELFADQLEAADQVLISRADRLSAEQVERVKSTLEAQVRSGTSLLPIERGVVDPVVVLGMDRQAAAPEEDHPHSHEPHDHKHHDHEHHHHDHHDHTHVEAVSGLVRLERIVSRAALEQWLPEFAADHAVVRLKGPSNARRHGLPQTPEAIAQAPHATRCAQGAPNHSQLPHGCGRDDRDGDARDRGACDREARVSGDGLPQALQPGDPFPAPPPDQPRRAQSVEARCLNALVPPRCSSPFPLVQPTSDPHD